MKLDSEKQQSDLVADPQINQQTLIYSNKVKIDDIVINKQKMSSDALNDGSEEAFESQRRQKISYTIESYEDIEE